MNDSFDDSYLKRLEPENYRDQAYVHWSLTIEDRKQGWLQPIVLYKFRELLTHSMFRYGLCCPIFVLMPDHFHMMWVGVLDGADQLPAMKHFRGRLNDTLAMLGFRLQPQGYDNVLKDDDRTEEAFHGIVNTLLEIRSEQDWSKSINTRSTSTSVALCPVTRS